MVGRQVGSVRKGSQPVIGSPEALDIAVGPARSRGCANLIVCIY